MIKKVINVCVCLYLCMLKQGYVFRGSVSVSCKKVIKIASK